jgi:alkanesulfonate monooxygenase SsuD/methylene tetrahydromethanopterin reductase-like flavin-dependent oxidoreductase (luciferase family)
MGTVSFGVFDWIDERDATSTSELYDTRLELIRAADEAGFFAYHLAEHHSTPLGMAPSPSVFLAAVARETRRIRLGPLVYLLPLYEPLRLAGEIAMLDQLSHGRFELGVGRGVSPYELAYRGVDHTTTKDVFLESLDTIVAALTTDVLSAGGQRTPRYEDVPVQLHPLQRPYPPLWYATTMVDSAAWAGAEGINLMGLGPAGDFRACVDAYRQAERAAAGRTDRLNGHVADPHLGLQRQVVLASTDEEAWEVAAAAYPGFVRNYSHLWLHHGDERTAARTDLDRNHRTGTMFIGSPSTVRALVEQQIDETGVNYFALSFAWGDLTPEQSRRSLELFAEHVMGVC